VAGAAAADIAAVAEVPEVVTAVALELREEEGMC